MRKARPFARHVELYAADCFRTGARNVARLERNGLKKDSKRVFSDKIN